jgi:hypothetical protein
MKPNDLLVMKMSPGFSDKLVGAELRITEFGYYEYRWTGNIDGQYLTKTADGRISKYDVVIIEDAILALMGFGIISDLNAAVDDIPRITIWHNGINGSEMCHNYGITNLETTVNDMGIVLVTWNKVMSCINQYINTAQRVDSAEASTIAVPPSEPSGSPR